MYVVPGKAALAMQVNIHPKSLTLTKVTTMGKQETAMQFYPVGERY